MNMDTTNWQNLIPFFAQLSLACLCRSVCMPEVIFVLKTNMLTIIKKNKHSCLSSKCDGRMLFWFTEVQVSVYSAVLDQ